MSLIAYMLRSRMNGLLVNCADGVWGKTMRRNDISRLLPQRFTWNIFTRQFWWENKVRADLRSLIAIGLIGVVRGFYVDLTAQGRRAFPPCLERRSLGGLMGAAEAMASGSGDPRQYKVRIMLFMRYGPPAPENCRCTLKPSGSRPINEGACA